MSSSGIIRSRAADRGFVLATTLLVTTLLTVMLAASFLLVSAEQRTTDNSFGTARALALAQAGLQNYLAQNRGLSDTSSYDSSRVTLVLGYADVVATKLRPSGAASGSSLALWVVRSTGVATSPVMAGQTQGSRTIAQFAQLNPGVLPARAALVALNGVVISAPPSGGFMPSNPVTGHDLGATGACVPPGGLAADTFAVSAPSGWYQATNTQPPAGVGVETSFPSWSNLYDTTHIDWAGLVGGNFIPDYTMPPAPWPPLGSSNYLVGYVAGDVTIPTGQRHGMLVVTGNVTMAANAHWDGIILAGGRFNPNATGVIHGMIVTGLNLALGHAVPADTIQAGQERVGWSWCFTQFSVNALSALVPMKNTWADTWTTY
jgi:Tfp pilus assembly protein PilX